MTPPRSLAMPPSNHWVILAVLTATIAGCRTPSQHPTGITNPHAIALESCPGSAQALHVIDKPGSYELQRNLMGAVDKHGVMVMTSSVTLNLNGHAMIGTENAECGIHIAEGCRNIEIVNGTIRSWPSHGIWAADAMNGRYTQLRLDDNGGDGMNVGVASTVEGCTVARSGRDGIKTDAGSTVSLCVSWRNGRNDKTGDGVDVGEGSIIEQTVTRGNAGAGLHANAGSILRQNTSRDNNGSGIKADEHVLIERCNTSYNRGPGIIAGSGGVVLNCISSLNDMDGIRAESFSRVTQNSLHGNGLETRSAGIRIAGIDNLVSRNHVVQNGIGIENLDGGNQLSDNICVHNGNGPDDDIVTHPDAPTTR